MGIYLNPGNTDFKLSTNSDIYVDKTDLITFTNHCLGKRNRFISVGRPRRFGKSMTAGMLAAYYSAGCNSASLFCDFKIAAAPSFKDHLNQHNVIFLNMQRFLSRAKSPLDMVPYLELTVLKELSQAYPNLVQEDERHLSSTLEHIYHATGKGFIFIIDEWDCLFRENQENIQAQTAFLDFLRDLLKDQLYVELAYMTGILPIKKYGTHSALNMFEECSMTDPGPLAEFVGFTDQEVQHLCQSYHVDYQEMKHWYDGYLFPDNLHIYSPKSVIDALLRKKFSNYWTGTETYEALKIYIDMDFDGLKQAIITMLGGGRHRINVRTFQNDMTFFKSKDDVLTLLVHLGYLGFDAEKQEVFIPNQEVAGEFENAVDSGGWESLANILIGSERLLEETLHENAMAVAKVMDSVHTESTSILAYHDENSPSCAITLAYFSAQKDYVLIRELPAGKGFADIVFLPKKHTTKPALLLELKWNQSAEGAIKQIKEKNYIAALKNYTGDILLVGINYDNTIKQHQCIIERIQV